MGKKEDQSKKSEQKRPAVVAILGHVDHGKTTLLEALSGFEITHKEAGGITQHVSAWSIDVDGEKMSFIDTPGHEAYSNIRSRGAQMTDIGLLVVAADDGVKPQTKEAVEFLKDAECPVIVAVNKIDRVDNKEAALEKVKGELAKLDLMAEDWGGDAIFVPISAKDKWGLEDLVDSLKLVAEVAELTDDGSSNEGIVLESYKDAQEGRNALILLKKGTIQKGDFIAGSDKYEKIKQIRTFKDENTDAAIVSEPMRIIGLRADLSAGDTVFFTKDEKKAEELVSVACELSTVDIEHQINTLAIKDGFSEDRILKLIIKTDTCSNKEAIEHSLVKLNEEAEKFKVKVIKVDVGEIMDNDVLLAESMGVDAILGFGIPISKESQNLANNQEIEVKTYDIIYKMLEDIEELAKGKIHREIDSKIMGKLELLKIFRNDAKEALVGGKVISGKVRKNAKFELKRGDLETQVQVGKGKVKSLHVVKDEVTEVQEGKECGIVTPGGIDFQEGDMIEFLF